MVPGIDTVRFDRFEKSAARRNAMQALAAAGRQPIYPIELRSQFGEDALILTLFDGQLDGFFIEVGAFDGYAGSVTYALECLGWTGLLVEASPDRAEECRRRRPHSRVVHAALGGREGEITFTITDDDAGGMFSHIAGTPGRKSRVLAAGTRSVAVPLLTLDQLLENQPGDIDAVVIDVEGSERDLIAGFDIGRHQPKVVMIEDNAKAPAAWLTEHMAALPYTYVAWLKVNRVYVRDDLAPAFAGRLRNDA